jgi:hypothetical protein
MKFITLGYDCSPAHVLRNLELRPFALPFDWVVSSVDGLERALSEDFAQYHTNLRFNDRKQRMIDEYGFEFPHDYPTVDSSNASEFVEATEYIVEAQIVNNWQDYYSIVKAKYDRRIERLRNILASTEPLLILCRYTVEDATKLYDIVCRHSKSTHVFMINAADRTIRTSAILHIQPEINNEWNELSIWKGAFDEVMSRIV